MKSLSPGIRFRFPIRFKIMVAILLVVTSAVSVITFTMANLFHEDKTTYIHDLTSVIVLHVAEEASALLDGCRDKLLVFGRLMAEHDLPQEQKAVMMKKLFEDFSEFIMITRYGRNGEAATVYDAKALEDAGLTKQSFAGYLRTSPLPLDQIREGKVHIANSTLSKKLPTFILAIPEPAGLAGGKGGVLAAVVRLENLQRLARRSRVFETFLVDEKGFVLAHAESAKVASRSAMEGLPRFGELSEQQGIGKTLEYSLAGVEMLGGFAHIGMGGLVAGVQIPKSMAFLTARSLLKSLLTVSLFLMAAAALLSHFWSRRLTNPIEKLSKATEVVGRGEFDIQVRSSSRDEIGDLAESFNGMASELKAREKALQGAQEQLVQSEKMAAFGQLGAGIAHEVKNPLAGILGYAQLSLRKVEVESPLHANLKIIEKETKRCKSIIDNLMKFARQEKVAYMPTDVNTVVEDAVAIVDHQLGINKVRLEKSLAEGLPQIMGNNNQIQQVLMNIMINAQQAMDGTPGTIGITSGVTEDGHISVRIRDTGPGIPEELRAKIFEPFFTTKAAGKGTGLGLSVSYGIIKDHGGQIVVESRSGEGTEFIITLPVWTGNGEHAVADGSGMTVAG